LSSPNPYEPPEALAAASSSPEEKAYPTRMRAALAGMSRGARLGFWTFSIIFWILGFVILVLAAVIPAFRRELFPWTTAAEGALSLGKDLFVLFVMVPLFALLYGSLPGGLIMGLAAAIRWRRPSDIEKPTTLVS
jgi:hypothetical protein